MNGAVVSVKVQKVQRVQRGWYRHWSHCVAGFKGFRRFRGFRGCGIALWSMSFIISLREMKTIQPPYGRKKHANRASPVGNAPLSPPTAVLLHGKASHVIFRSLCSLTNHVRLPPRRGKSTLRFPWNHQQDSHSGD